ncbi:MAG: hypothetical protein M3162_04475 [Thermoproteota archaeon]|nr:hypothetical protein [Thermoproteota archaeon]
MTESPIVIVNPNSSGGQTGKNWDSINSTLEKYFGNDIEVVFTKKSGDGTTLARGYLEKGYRNIIPIGGDGMINEVANGFFKQSLDKFLNFENQDNNSLSSVFHMESINPEATLTILPGGTRNVLVKSLGLPPELDECCKVVTASDATKKIDVIAAIVKGTNSDPNYIHRIFLNAAEIGMGAEIISRSKTVRNTISSRLLSTFAGIVATLPTYKSNTCEVIEGSKGSGDDDNINSSRSNKIKNRILTKMTMGMVSNGRFIGGGFDVTEKADMADGLLDTTIVKHSDSFKILHKLATIKKGEESVANEDDIYQGQSETVAWVSEAQNNITVSVDGEPIGILPAFFMVFPSSLKIKYI